MTEIHLVSAPLATIGESPVWDPDTERLYWIDVEGRIFRCTPDGREVRIWQLRGRPSSLALRAGGGAILTSGTTIQLFDFDTGEAEVVADTGSGPLTRFNDGKVDRQGRFVTGLSDNRLVAPALFPFVDAIEPSGCLVRLDPDLSVHRLAEGFGLTNGPCFSPDGATFYCGDSFAHRVYAFDYDPDTGDASNRRVLASFEDPQVLPDGATVDEEGFVWVAANFAGEIRRFAPDGTLERTLTLPSPKPTSVAFGGADMDVLFVTTMGDTPLPLDTVPGGPLGGSVLAVRGLGTRGVPEVPFAG